MDWDDITLKELFLISIQGMQSLDQERVITLYGEDEFGDEEKGESDGLLFFHSEHMI